MVNLFQSKKIMCVNDRCYINAYCIDNSYVKCLLNEYVYTIFGNIFKIRKSKTIEVHSSHNNLL